MYQKKRRKEEKKKEGEAKRKIKCTNVMNRRNKEAESTSREKRKSFQKRESGRKRTRKGFDYFGFALQTAGDYICHGGLILYADDTGLDDLL